MNVWCSPTLAICIQSTVFIQTVNARRKKLACTFFHCVPHYDRPDQRRTLERPRVTSQIQHIDDDCPSHCRKGARARIIHTYVWNAYTRIEYYARTLAATRRPHCVMSMASHCQTLWTTSLITRAQGARTCIRSVRAGTAIMARTTCFERQASATVLADWQRNEHHKRQVFYARGKRGWSKRSYGCVCLNTIALRTTHKRVHILI